MIQKRVYLQVISAIGLIASVFFGAQWLTLPSNLTKATAHMVVADAEFIQSRWPQARFVRDDGTFEQASCGRVSPLCAQLRSAPIKRLAVWFAPSALGEEAWVVAVESESQVLLSEARQQSAFADFRTKPALMAGLFLLLSLSGFFFARLQPRAVEAR